MGYNTSITYYLSNMYQIVRFYSDYKKQSRLIKTVRTLEEAQAHCNDPKTRKEGKWFDGYQKIK